jgi:hypothetical protein
MNDPHRTYTDAVMTAFGTPTKLARALGESISTVHAWNRNGRIPRWWVSAIEKAAIELSIKDLPAYPGKPGSDGTSNPTAANSPAQEAS